MRQQEQQGGPSSASCSSSDSFPLCHLHTAECGSESPEKHEARAGSEKVDHSHESKESHLHGVQLGSVLCARARTVSVLVAVEKARSQSRMRSIVLFYLCFVLCLCLGVACVACVCLWSSRWRGGFAWDRSAFQFNWHPVLMTTGLVVVYGYAAVLYRVPLTWGQNKLPWKLLHASLMLLALILSIVGLCAVFDFHNARGTPNLYSLHSWIGISATALFAMQWAVGVLGFLLPWTPVSFRKMLKPIHVWLGGSILTLSIAACISGINEKLIFALKGNGNDSYAHLPAEALFANSLGVLIVAFGLVLLFILSNHNWQRPESRPEDMTYTPLLQDENE